MSTEPHRKAVGSIFDITITCNTYNAQYFSKEFGGFSLLKCSRSTHSISFYKHYRASTMGQSLYTGNKW